MSRNDRRSSVIGRLIRDERGVELIEFLGFFPLVLMVIVISWQIILVGYTGVVAAGAAREGARAAVVRQDVGNAVRFASPGFDGRRSHTVSGFCSEYSGSPVNVRVQLEVPHTVIPFIGAISYPKVSAAATMRCEPPYNAQ